MPFYKRIIMEIKETINQIDVMVLLVAGPIFLTLLFGGVYLNTYLEDIPIAVLDEDGSSMSRMIGQQFNEDDRFNVVGQLKSRQSLKEKIDSGEVHMGVYIPPNFSKDVKALKASEVVLMVDGTNMVIGNNAYAQAASIIQTLAVGTQIKLIEAKGVMPNVSYNMAMPFGFNDRILYDSKMSYMNYLILGFIAVFLQQVMLSAIGMSVIKKGHEIAKEQTMLKLAVKILVIGTFGTLSSFGSVFMASKLFNVAIRGNVLTALLLTVIFIIAISCPAIILASLIKDKLKFAQISFMLSLLTFVSSGYLWTIELLPKPLVLGVKILWPLINFARVFDEVLFKGLTLHAIKGNLFELIGYACIWMPIAIFVLKKSYGGEIEKG